ncbi:hypothetical protein U1Q18_011604, partial [Sarracenia purpurea var. burkii]
KDNFDNLTIQVITERKVKEIAVIARDYMEIQNSKESQMSKTPSNFLNGVKNGDDKSGAEKESVNLSISRKLNQGNRKLPNQNTINSGNSQSIQAKEKSTEE